MILGWLGLAGVGLCLGLFGAGGTSIALPVLVYWVGLSPHQAVAVSLVLVGASSALGAALHARRGYVRWAEAAAFAPFGMAGAAAGSRLSYLLSGRALLLTFSALLSIIAVRMWLERKQTPPPTTRRRWPLIAAAGLGIGIMTGVLGNGGGFVIVPALVYCAGLGMKEAMATSLPVIAANCLVAFAGHTTQQQLSWKTVLAMLAATMAGMALGVELSHRAEPGPLKRGFAGLLLTLALFIAWRNL